MATRVQGNYGTFVAEADLSSKMYYIVKLGSGAKSMVLADGATANIIGVVEAKPKNGEAGEVFLRNAAGTGKVVAGGNITAGAWLTSDGNGKAIATTTDGDEVIGRALMAGVANDVIEFMPAHCRLFIA